MSNKSKAKGNGAERDLCKILSEELGGSFTRVPNSGSFTGATNSYRIEKLSSTQNKIFRGDIIPPDNMPNMYIECKAYKDFRFHQLLQSGNCPILETWIKQTMVGTTKLDAIFICFKINLRGWYIAIPANNSYVLNNYCIYNSGHGQMYITEMISFLKINSQQIVKKCGAGI